MKSKQELFKKESGSQESRDKNKVREVGNQDERSKKSGKSFSLLGSLLLISCLFSMGKYNLNSLLPTTSFTCAIRHLQVPLAIPLFGMPMRRQPA
jgi:hypothetical protein